MSVVTCVAERRDWRQSHGSILQLSILSSGGGLCWVANADYTCTIWGVVRFVALLVDTGGGGGTVGGLLIPHGGAEDY